MAEEIKAYKVGDRIFESKEEAEQFERFQTLPPMQPVNQENFCTLVNTCAEALDFVKENRYLDECYKQWIFEAALIAVFGADVFDWMNYWRE